jgi:hypothetical protein
VGRDVLTTVKNTKLITLLSCLCLVCSGSTAQTTQRSLLLVCSDDSILESLSLAEVRKIFLGVPVTKEEVRIRPYLNSTDPLATNVFLQQVVFMSEREYKRQLLSRVFRLGDLRPPEYDDLELLIDDLRNTPGSLSFIWSDEFESHAGLKVLSVLWTSSNN